jgi:hypothetical protein
MNTIHSTQIEILAKIVKHIETAFPNHIQNNSNPLGWLIDVPSPSSNCIFAHWNLPQKGHIQIKFSLLDTEPLQIGILKPNYTDMLIHKIEELSLKEAYDKLVEEYLNAVRHQLYL